MLVRGGGYGWTGKRSRKSQNVVSVSRNTGQKLSVFQTNFHGKKTRTPNDTAQFLGLFW